MPPAFTPTWMTMGMGTTTKDAFPPKPASYGKSYKVCTAAPRHASPLGLKYPVSWPGDDI